MRRIQCIQDLSGVFHGTDGLTDEDAVRGTGRSSGLNGTMRSRDRQVDEIANHLEDKYGQACRVEEKVPDAD